jgi:uracil-DNA glycosylase family 4
VASSDTKRSLTELEMAISGCSRCPRLVAWREETAADPPRRFRGQEYWARPVPGFGDPQASILVVGLAPAAHGGNRTGRVFTGDSSGDWLFASLHRTGLANQGTSISADDGLRLSRTWVSAVVRCAPPANKPTPVERDTCLPWLERELGLLSDLRVVVALGAFAWDGMLRAVRALGAEVPRPKPKFGHGAEVTLAGAVESGGGAPLAGGLQLIGCYHPSQHNTFTGRLTEEMLDATFRRALECAGG